MWQENKICFYTSIYSSTLIYVQGFSYTKYNQYIFIILVDFISSSLASFKTEEFQTKLTSLNRTKFEENYSCQITSNIVFCRVPEKTLLIISTKIFILRHLSINKKFSQIIIIGRIYLGGVD